MIIADAAVTAIVVSGALGRDVSWEDVARVWFYDLIWFVLTDLCKIPLTMSIENLFPPLPVTEAPVPDESDHVLAFGCVDLGYAYVRDTKENVRRRSSRRSSADVEAPSGAAASRGATNYYADCAPRKPSLPARDPRLARRLWEESERLLGMPRGAAKPAAPDVEDGRGGFDGEPPRSPKSPASPPFVAGEGGGSVSPLSPAPSASMSMHRGGGAAVEAEGRSAAEPGSPASPAIRVTPSKSGRWGLGMAPAKASAD